ncbi:MAG: hypothetical protein S4CHLAM2_14990 [Chlamydiales bacterium]|nr:hypothetical protein [Chlamydiales bacterium]
MKIGIDATPLKEHLTGVGNYVYYLLEGLIRKRGKDQFFLYAICHSSRLAKLAEYKNVTVRVHPFLGFSEALWSQTTLAWLCQKEQIDLFWGTTQSVPLWARHKSVITVYDFTYRLYPKTVSRVRGTYLRWFGKYLYKKADVITTISQGTATRLEQYYGLKADQVIIPPLKDLTVADAVLEQFSLKSKDYYLMVGTREPRKNIVPTLRAFQGKHPLVLVGAKGWRDSEIAKELQKKSSQILCLGYLPDQELNALVKGAKAYVMPSLYEGYGMPIAEARSLGTPVICCDVREMIEAAEGDALIVPHAELERAFTTDVKAPQKTTYPTNQALIDLLSEAFAQLAQQNQGCG